MTIEEIFDRFDRVTVRKETTSYDDTTYFVEVMRASNDKIGATFAVGQATEPTLSAAAAFALERFARYERTGR